MIAQIHTEVQGVPSPGTLLSRLDPRSKLIFIFFFALAVFLAHNTSGFLLLSFICAVAIRLSALPLASLLKKLRPVLWLAVFTLLLHLFTTHEGEVMWQWGALRIYGEGIERGVIFAVRLLLLFIMSALLSLSTPPTRLAEAMERLMRPLSHLRVPVAELAFMMSMALRFIPFFMLEAEKVMKAQTARGADFESRHLPQRIRSLFPLLIPLIVGLFYRAEELATALEARGYRRGREGSTRYRKLRWGKADWYVMGALIPLFALLLFLRGEF